MTSAVATRAPRVWIGKHSVHELPARPLVVVSGTASDAHTWNLVYLQLLIEEFGYQVANLGPCVPVELLLAECVRLRPALVVVSSVNGHGGHDGAHLIRRLRALDDTARLPVVIGGKLGISDEDGVARARELMSAGFDAVFEDSATAVAGLRKVLQSVATAHPLLTGSTGSAT